MGFINPARLALSPASLALLQRNPYTMKPGISFVIQEPSADLDTPEYEGNKMYIRGAVHSMDDLTPSNIFPARVLEYVSKVFDDDNYRAEILEGRTMFKFYRKPSRDLVPQEEDGTLLEKHLGTMGLGSGPGNYAVARDEEAKKYELRSGAGSSSPINSDTLDGPEIKQSDDLPL